MSTNCIPLPDGPPCTHFPNLMAGLQTRPAPSALPDVERQSVGGLVDGALVNLVDGRLVRVRVHVVGTV